MSRDLFEFLGENYKLNTYVARQSFASVGVDASELCPGEPPFDSPFQERMRVGDVRGDGLARLEEKSRTTRLVLLDLCDERIGLYAGDLPGLLTDSVERRTRAPLPLRRIPFGTVEHLDLWEAGFRRWVAGARRAVPMAQIVVLAPPWAELSDDGGSVPPSFGVTAGRARELAAPYLDIVRDCGIAVMGERIDVRADAHHQWGLAPFHYARFVYEMLAAEVKMLEIREERS